MTRTLTGLSLVLLVLLSASGCESRRTGTASAPAGDRMTVIDRTCTNVVPNGRLLTPMGRAVETAPHPHGIALSADGPRPKR